MRIKFIIGFLFTGILIFGGCAKRAFVTYDQVDEANWIEVTMVSGKKFEGTVLKTEPHQLTLLQKNRQRKVFAKSSIRSIKRKPPLYDDFGKGISEEKISSVQSNRNSIIYGIGGGALSFGVSFFVGSLIGDSIDEGGTALAATTAVGSGLGTFLFVRAGKNKDRREAIENIREDRRSTELKKEVKKKTKDEIQDVLKEEKKKQEKLRKQREELLRKLEESKEIE